MARGSKIIKFRCPDLLEARIVAAFEASRDQKDSEVVTVSDWIRKALKEILEKPERARASKARAREKKARQTQQ